MMPIAFLLLLPLALPASAAPAETFDDRVGLARRAEADPDMQAYPAAFVRHARRHLARTMRSCAASTATTGAQPFTLIADIGGDGKAAAVEVNSESDAAACFASGFTSATFPKPPDYPGRAGFPVMMKVRIAGPQGR